MSPNVVPAGGGGKCPFSSGEKPKDENLFNKPHENTGEHSPFGGTRITGVDGTGPTLTDWYPNRSRVDISDDKSSANPFGKDYDYPKEFQKIDYKQLKKDLEEWMTQSQDWWPADYGHYGPQVIRTTWHSAGTYRIADGRGGLGQSSQRFSPISSWEDNGNTDKTRRLSWPIKKKYGDQLSWADLIALAGNVALESMGVQTVGFGGGREDAWQPDNETYWGSERIQFDRVRWVTSQTDKNSTKDLAAPLASSEYGSIYVNPEGPAGSPDPWKSAEEIRHTFHRMAMTDAETVALIAGGHSFGKSHGATPKDHVGPPPELSSIENQGLGWINNYKTGNAEYTTTNGCEGSWIQNPTRWDKEYVENSLDNEWVLTRSPAGAVQWKPAVLNDKNTTPDAHIPGKRHPLMMFTSDIALKVDPEFSKTSKHFRDNDETVFFKAFAEAWYKSIHRDTGPYARMVGPEVPKEERIWQDPIPKFEHESSNASEIKELKATILKNTKLDPLEFARAAWASASTYRGSDHRGGANGARIALDPQIKWEVNRPEQLQKVLAELNQVQSSYKKPVSLADLIVLAGAAAIEKAAHDGGFTDIEVPFTPGRGDARAEDTDAESFEWSHPVQDGFRNYEAADFDVTAEHFLIDRANSSTLTAPQSVALIGGFRALNFNWDSSDLGVFTQKPGTLSNDFFVNSLDMSTRWVPLDDKKTRFEGVDRATGTHQWYATRTDLIFGHNDQLRAVAETYGGNSKRFVKDFVAAWDKVMNSDRFDLHH